MKLTTNLAPDNRMRQAAPLLLGVGIGALLAVAVSSQGRLRALQAKEALARLTPATRTERLLARSREAGSYALARGREASTYALERSRLAGAYAKEHPGLIVAVTAGLAGLALATLAYRNREQLRERFQHIASNDAIHVSRTIEIAASPEQVYEVWSQYDSFPHFMSMVKEVRSLGGDRSHWKVKGPAGVPVEWNSVITDREPGRLLAWHSEDGSPVEHAGRVELERCPTGTRATVSMTYRPPLGRLGHAVASLFGRNPAQEMEQDLQRMKRYVEEQRGPRAVQSGTRSNATGEMSATAGVAPGSMPV